MRISHSQPQQFHSAHKNNHQSQHTQPQQQFSGGISKVAVTGILALLASTIGCQSGVGFNIGGSQLGVQGYVTPPVQTPIYDTPVYDAPVYAPPAAQPQRLNDSGWRSVPKTEPRAKITGIRPVESDLPDGVNEADLRPPVIEYGEPSKEPPAHWKNLNRGNDNDGGLKLEPPRNSSEQDRTA